MKIRLDEPQSGSRDEVVTVCENEVPHPCGVRNDKGKKGDNIARLDDNQKLFGAEVPRQSGEKTNDAVIPSKARKLKKQ